jgi:hypothetical protein
MNDVLDEILSNPIVHTVGVAILLAAVALWLAAAWWAYQDASRRTESSLAGFVAAAWIILSTPLMLPLSLAIYATARPQRTASDDRTVALMARLNEIAADQPACPGCAAVIDPDWIRCPTCATWFATACQACGEWSAAGLELCPYCGVDRDATPAGWVATDPSLTPTPDLSPTPAQGARPDPGATGELAPSPAATGSAGFGAGHGAGHGRAAAGKPAAAVRNAGAPRLQRGRMASSWRPSSYEASRASSSVSS